MDASDLHNSIRPRGKTSTRKFLLICVLLGGILALLAGTVIPAGASPQAAENEGASAATPTIGEHYGVASSHLMGFDSSTMEAEFKVMNEVGARWVRCGFSWCDIEYNQGVFDWSLTDLVVQKAGEHGVNILAILGGTPSWANGGKGPWYPPLKLEDWTNYVANIVSRYKDKIKVWEIWNEENIKEFWGPEPDPYLFSVGLIAASLTIKAIDPSAKVVMGGLAGVGYYYLKDCLQYGIADYVDAIAYHPYPETLGYGDFHPQEEWCRQIVGYMLDLIDDYNQNNPDIQLWITELGYTTCEQVPPGVDFDTQANYMLRNLINYAGQPIDMFIWFSLRDYPETQGLETVKYGLVKLDFQRKPSFYYFRTFQQVFGKAVSTAPDAATFSCGNPATLEAHCFRQADGDLVLGIWKRDDLADTLSFTVSDPSFANPRTIDPLTGNDSPTPGASRDAQGKLTIKNLTVGKNPVIIKLDKVGVSSISPKQATEFTVSLNCTLQGSGFQPGAAVKLQMDSYTINAYNVKVVSESKITCTVGFFGMPPGLYDVTVTNPDGSRATLGKGFKLNPLCGMGSGGAVLALGLMLGVLALAGSTRLKALLKK